uniref:Transposase Tc1-like domain-containing protein n=1 Tax=Cyclopterus lumpus TaxID=8103 RepID=A0A8C2ZVB1_CYCLU
MIRSVSFVGGNELSLIDDGRKVADSMDTLSRHVFFRDAVIPIQFPSLLETGGNGDRKRSGRPKATTGSESQQLQARLHTGPSKQVSVSTVKRRLGAAGLKGRVAVRQEQEACYGATRHRQTATAAPCNTLWFTPSWSGVHPDPEQTSRLWHNYRRRKEDGRLHITGWPVSGLTPHGAGLGSTGRGGSKATFKCNTHVGTSATVLKNCPL